MLGKDTTSIVYRERVSVLEQESASISADVKSITAQHTAEKALFQIVRMPLALHSTA